MNFYEKCSTQYLSELLKQREGEMEQIYTFGIERNNNDRKRTRRYEEINNEIDVIKNVLRRRNQ